ncbi:hypothetical protein GWI33_001793 [Rhynchophorus ferrugineus]|uniref:Uncharacterized protein n=1 Tax=Rhynchophorus ferrugineus TaxID=354439 RepID=A0A834INM4_RHYFE|nr:hypothetical protein GWI33_001793 [Rhynchophorus ferrugineus]
MPVRGKRFVKLGSDQCKKGYPKQARVMSTSIKKMVIFSDSERDDSVDELRGLDLREVLRLLDGGALIGGGLMGEVGFNLTIGVGGRSGGMGEGVGEMFKEEEAEERGKEVRGDEEVIVCKLSWFVSIVIVDKNLLFLDKLSIRNQDPYKNNGHLTTKGQIRKPLTSNVTCSLIAGTSATSYVQFLNLRILHGSTRRILGEKFNMVLQTGF